MKAYFLFVTKSITRTKEKYRKRRRLKCCGTEHSLNANAKCENQSVIVKGVVLVTPETLVMGTAYRDTTFVFRNITNIINTITKLHIPARKRLNVRVNTILSHG